ncbi:MAG: helix-turn-helix transcriptional regulator [Desulfovibrio sp.]|nr:helix-turn-helix transcriptional regulator [Desulfovibrio sp.]
MSTKTKISLLQDALAIMRRACNGRPYGNQAELARATGVSEANISRWLSGKSRPTLTKLEPVLQVLGVRLVQAHRQRVSQEKKPRRIRISRRRTARKCVTAH